MATLNIEELKQELGPKLRTVEQVAPPPGVPTGWTPLDRFLLWHGFPKGAVSLMVSHCGGASTLWSRAAGQITQRGQWAAWVNEPSAWLTPWSLRKRGVDLSKLIVVEPPVADPKTSERQLLWCLQELMSLSLFELIGCDLGEWELKEHQILKVKKLAMRYQTAVVFTARKKPRKLSSFYSLILEFERARVCVTRALHRSTPHALERKDLYADTLPQLATGFRSLAI